MLQLRSTVLYTVLESLNCLEIKSESDKELLLEIESSHPLCEFVRVHNQQLLEYVKIKKVTVSCNKREFDK